MTDHKRLGVLTERRFRIFWVGYATTVLGDALMPATLVLTILALGGSASDIGLVIGIPMAIRFALLLVGGAIADRLPRRAVLAACDTFSTAVQIVMGLLLLAGHGSVQALLIAAVAYGAVTALARPALPGLVPELTSKERLQQANALISITRSVANIAGPALGGLIVVLASPGWAYLFDAGTFAVSAMTLLLLRIPSIPRKIRENVLRQVLSGWRELVARPWYWAGLICHAVWNLGSCSFLVLGPVIVAQQDGGSSNWAVVATGTGIGSLVGGVIALRWHAHRPLIGGHLVLLLAAPQFVALLVPAPVMVITAASAVSAAGVTLANQVWTTATQSLMPEEILSRMSSYNLLISFLVAPLGYSAVGPLSEVVGTPQILTISLVLVTIPVLALLAVPSIRSVRRSPDGTFSFAGTGVAAEDTTRVSSVG
jgi:MFS family permease